MLLEVLPAESYLARHMVTTHNIFLGFLTREIANNSLLRNILSDQGGKLLTRSLSLEEKKDRLRFISNEHVKDYSETARIRQILRDLVLRDLLILKNPEAYQTFELWALRERRFPVEEVAQKSYDVTLQTVLSSQTNHFTEFMTIALEAYTTEFMKHLDEWVGTIEKEFNEKTQKELRSCPY